MALHKALSGSLEQYSDLHSTVAIPTTTMSYTFRLCTFPQFFVSVLSREAHITGGVFDYLVSRAIKKQVQI